MQQQKKTEKFGRDEMNLAEFPISLLSKRHKPSLKTIEFADTIKGEDGKVINREWIITGSDKFGLPLAIDNDVLTALLLIGKEKNFHDRKIGFCRYRLLNIMRWDVGGRSYKRTEESLNRLKGVSIYAKNAFWDNEKKNHTTASFGIIDDYRLSETCLPGQEFPCYVNLNEVIYESIKAGYIKSIDVNTYYSLNSAVTKRLYRYLDKKRYNKEKYEINLFTLAKVHLGLQKCEYASQIKQQLNPSHMELIKAEFLKSAEYQRTSNGSSEKIVYTFTSKETSANALLDQDQATINNKLIGKLVKIGVTLKVAEQLMKEYPNDYIEAQIGVLLYRKAKDPAAVLIASIQGSWAMPAEAVRQKEAELEKQRTMDEESEKAKHRKKIEEYRTKLNEEELTDLIQQATELAREDGGNFLRNKEIPEYLIKSYLHVLIEKRLDG